MVAYYIIGGILLAMAVFLVIAVIMQNGKSHNLSGTIAGGAETFFGKTKGKAMDRLLSRWTTIIAIIFVILVLVLFIVQGENPYDPDADFDKLVGSENASSSESSSSSASESSANAKLVVNGYLVL